MPSNLEFGTPAPPHGLDAIISTFGDIFAYIREDQTLNPAWQTQSLGPVQLPFPLILAWDKSRTVQKITCHKLLAQSFCDVFTAVQSAGLQSRITSFGGCFSFRPQRTGARLSTHAWGIAIDLNTESNRQGPGGNMDPAIVRIFQQAGFCWGGEWKGKICDPMHFQFCTGY